jgi:hypothetical protein
MVDGINRDGNWTNSYLISIIGGMETDEQRLKVLKTTSPDLDIVAVNSPTFSTNGVKGNGTTSYVNLKWNMVNDGLAGVRDSLTFGVCVIENAAVAAADMGAFAGSNQSLIAVKYSDNNTYYSINDASNDARTGFTSGFGFAQRIGSSARRILQGDYLYASSAASVPEISEDIFGGAGNNGGSPALLSTKTQMMFYIGTGAVNMAQIRSRMNMFRNERGIVFAT